MNTQGVRASIDISAKDNGLDKQIQNVVKLNIEIQKLAQAMSKSAIQQQKLATEVAKTNTQNEKTVTQMAKTIGQHQKNATAKEQDALKTQKLRIQVDKLNESSKKTTGTMSLFSSKLFVLGSNLSNIAIFAKNAANKIYGLTESAAGYIETQNLFQVSMGDTIGKATKFVNEMSNAFNLNDEGLKKSVGTFNLLGTQMGLTADQAYLYSETLTKLSADMASLRNSSVDVATSKLKSGIVGEVEALRQWGIDVSEATLKQEALANGITKSYDKMSYGEKSLLRYSAILKQTSADQTDFSRTLESPAQLMKQFREQIAATGRAIGTLFLKPLQKVLPVLIAITMVIRHIAEWLAVLFGITDSFGDDTANTSLEIAEGTSDALGNAVKNAKQLKKYLGGFDELNNTTSKEDSSSGSGAGISTGIDDKFLDLLKGYDNKMKGINNRAADIRDRIMEWLGFTKIVDEETGQISFKLNDGYTNLEKIRDIGLIIAGIFASIKIAGFVKELVGIGSTLSGLLPSLGGGAVAGGAAVGGAASAGGAVAGGAAAGLAGATVFSELPAALALLTQAFASLSAGTATFGEALSIFVLPALEALAPIIGSVVLVVGGLAVAFQGVKELVGGEEFKGVMEIIGGIALVVAGVAVAFAAWPVAIAAGIVALLALGTAFSETWSTYIEPIKTAFNETISGIIEILESLWVNTLKPIIDNITEGFTWLWETTLKPLFDSIGELIGELVLLILDLWNNVLQPFVMRIVENVGPPIAAVVNFVVDVVMTAVNIVIGIIQGVIDVVKGVIKIIRGLINLDFKMVLDGLLDIVKGIGNFLISIVEGVANLIIDGINGLIGVVYGGVKGFVNGLLTIVNTVLEAIDKDPIKKVTGNGPKIKKISISRFENGGMPDVGSLFVAGEGRTTEFVGDIGGRTNVVNEMQLENALYNAMIRANKNKGEGTTVNEIYIGGNKTDAILAKRSQRNSNILGKGGLAYNG